VEGLIAAGEIDMHTTYFETVTAMALTVFEEERVDMVVFEVGLGGRLDATNVVIPDLAVIAPIDFDHEAYLGTSLDAIAREKAGILKPGVPAVFARQRPEAAGVLEARLIDAQWSEHWPVRNLEVDARGSSFRLEDLTIRCPLAGEHQVENALTATLALRRLGIAKAAIEAGIAGAQWPGRLERVSEQPEIILDGAHNPAGARALAAYIERFYAGRRIRLIYGAMRDKAVAEISGILFPLADEVTLTAPRQARAMAPEMLREIAEHPNMRIAPDIETALGSAGEGVTFVTGSLFLVAEARAAIIGTKR
jgi:dihydrofolate synthase/folylpolyglutamate synthase